MANGELPEGWDSTTIGAAFDVRQGKSLSAGRQTGLTNKPFLRTSNVLWGKLMLDHLDRMDFTSKECEALALQPGDLLVCEGGDIGRTAIWNGELEDCFFQNHLHRLRKRVDDIEPSFVMYWMQAAIKLWNRYEGHGNSTTIPNLSRSRLLEFEFAKPPLPEQRAIARVLSKLQEAVEVQDRIIATLKELKAATLAKLFREGLRGEPLKETEIGEIPESWEVVRLSQVADFASGGTPSKANAHWWSGSIPWASPKDMKVSWLTDTQDHISEEAAKRGSRIVPAGSIFIVVRGMILARDVPVAMTVIPMAFNQDMRAILPKKSADPGFLLYAIASRKSSLTEEISNSSHGTRRMSASAVESLKVPFPEDVEEQKTVGRALRSLEERELAAVATRSTLEKAFSSMLHLLMTGEVRIKDVERD
jgi:type I restriction enzyme S subunit